MDLRSMLERPDEAEVTAVDAVLGPPEEHNGRVAFGGHADRARRHLLLPALHAVQDATGSVSRGALSYISDRIPVPPAEAYGVATFYALFNTDKPGGTSTHICDDIVCAQYGVEQICATLDTAGIDYERSPCLGQCDRAPAALLHDPGRGYGNAAPVRDMESVMSIDFEELAPGLIHQGQSELRLLRRIGKTDPTSLGSYLASGGFEALTEAQRMGPEAVIAELKTSNLRGRGGAAFPIGIKWEGVRNAPGNEKFVIANGDESEPGTFKDRLLMEGDPFALVEAMAIYGYVTGASKGYIYVRGEYPTAVRRLRNAIDQTKTANLLEGLDLEVRRGAGAYICGEETALFASIEGYRGEPRQKPPFPTTHGVFGKPTGINNIETLVAVIEVIEIGGEAFARVGTEQSTGPKLFCASGDVARPGVYEVEFGTTLGELLELAGGMQGGSEFGAVLLGGAAGVFARTEALSVPLTFEDTRAAGTTLGSGSMIFFDSTTDFGGVLRRIAQFFRDESCGQCVPCRIGTVRQEEALARLRDDRPLGSHDAEKMRLDDLALVMTDASICGLGQTASSAVQSAIRLGLA